MSCKEYRDKLIAALARGDSSLAGDVAVHLGICAECKKVYEAQVRLFGAIDSGVRAMVNEAVPASLLPRVRAQIAQADMPRRMWAVSWSFAAVAVAAVLVISVTVLKRSRDNTNKVADRSPAAGQRASSATGVRAVLPQVAAVGPKRRSTEVKTATAPREAVKAPEVIVLAEERAAFARFVTDLPEEREVAVAFTRPATVAKDEAVEIALLQIEELDVKPLESSSQ